MGSKLNNIIGKKIKNALDESCISRSQISDRLNISRQTLNNYINGSTSVSFETLLKIAELTDKNKEYFYPDYPEEEKNFNKTGTLFESYIFRSDNMIPLNLKNRFEQKIRQYADIEKINDISPHQFKIDSPLNKLDKPHIEQIAMKIRGLLEIGPLTPISNPVYELERNNVKIIQFPEDNQDISGFSAHNDELGYCIYLNSKCTIERRFFTAAHELAHLIFHKKDYIHQNSRSLQNSLNIVSKDKIKEDIADEFAGLFLVPSASLSSFCKNNFIEQFVFENVIILKKYFNVSAKCMIRRLFKEGFITKLQHDLLNSETDKKIDPYHEYEPIEKNRIFENHRFTNLVNRALLNKKITEMEATAYFKDL